MKKLIPAIILGVAAVLMLVSFFLPYATAGDDAMGEYANVSMVDFAKSYAESEHIEYMVYVVLFGILALFTLLTVLFALIKKPIPAIVFVILASIVYLIQCWDYKERGIVPGIRYEYGIGHYLFFISALSVFITSIWYLCVRNDKPTPPTYYNQYPNTPY